MFDYRVDAFSAAPSLAPAESMTNKKLSIRQSFSEQKSKIK
jgi:hypothetical protein